MAKFKLASIPSMVLSFVLGLMYMGLGYYLVDEFLTAIGVTFPEPLNTFFPVLWFVLGIVLIFAVLKYLEAPGE